MNETKAKKESLFDINTKKGAFKNK